VLDMVYIAFFCQPEIIIASFGSNTYPLIAPFSPFRQKNGDHERHSHVKGGEGDGSREDN